MKILLSPAKKMNFDSNVTWPQTTPHFLNQSKTLIDVLRTYKPYDLEKLMKLSVNLAELNYERYQNWQENPKLEQSQAAALAFDGEVYRGLDAKNLSTKAIDYLTNNLWILSGLYGVLQANSAILPYRLEMGTKLTVNEHKNLYSFWQETLTKHVNQNTQKNEAILNLASNEYVKVLDKNNLHSEVYDVEFKDYKNGKLKQIMVYFKQARGALARFCAENELNKIEDLKHFTGMDYSYSTEFSTENKFVFIR